MYIRRKVFSIMEDDCGEARYFSTTDYVYDCIEQREFGAKSKALAIFAPGAYQAKEAAKYGYDEDEYKNVRGKYALKGLFTPGTATYVKKQCEKMAEEGATQEEIRGYLESTKISKDGKKGRVGLGVAEVLTGAPTVSAPAAQVIAAVDALGGKRAHFDKEGKPVYGKKSKKD